MSDNVFLKKGRFSSLEDFARLVLALLKCGNIEEHHSANYWGGQYFVGRRGEVSLTIALSDDSGFEDYDCWLSVEVKDRSDAEETALGEDLARTLTVNGFEAARPYSKEEWLYRKSTIRRIVYRRKQQNTDSPVGSEALVEKTIEEI